ncbi:biotin--[acetyl-CoA-carboxylase] ligase [Gangjinia marincola]|uniref:Biotin--[acetyl-CoA-carboxylase] ligase n=1 Tax=Gangjinia marincola TaxID=578463 RepID=A0ABN1MJ21_9FLAO
MIQLIKVDATDSTNTFLKDYLRSNNGVNKLCIQAGYQLEGRGQAGNHWKSEKDQNLLFSVLYSDWNLKSHHQYIISIATAVSIKQVLDGLKIPDVMVKWPNDILAERKKIAGILIENTLKNGRVAASIIGVGLNVNQTSFNELPNATSLRQLTGQSFDLDELLQKLLIQLENNFEKVSQGNIKNLIIDYHQYLFRKDKASTFQRPDGSTFIGIIQQVAKNGKIILLEEDDHLNTYDVKEIKLLY